MNLSIYQIGYLGSQAKDTPHSGKNRLLKYGKADFLPVVTDKLWLEKLGWNQQSKWPLARWLHDMEAANTNGHAHLLFEPAPEHRWLLVQPIHLALQRDSFSLDTLIRLQTEEYRQLTDILNTHFSADHLQFLPSSSQQYWFMELSPDWEIRTEWAQAALHRNIQRSMPTGAHAHYLRKIMNEVQMLMHEHPLNQHRLQQGLTEINSIWFSGEDSGKQKPQAKGPLLLNSPYLIQPDRLDLPTALAQHITDAVMLIETDEQLDWDTLYQSMQTGRLKRLDVYWPLAQGTLHVRMMSLDRFKLWRKPRSIETLTLQYAQNH